MKIMFLDSIESQTWGGMEEWIRLAADGLIRKGHTCVVAGRKESQFLERLKAKVPNVEVLPLEIGGDFHPLTIAHLRRQLEDRQIDVLVVNFTKDIRLGGLAARFDGDTRVVWSVGLDITKDSWSHRWLTPRLIDGVLVPSEALKRQITALGYIEPELVSVIPIGIDTRSISDVSQIREQVRARFGISQDQLIAVTVGRFVEQKGHSCLIAAVASSADKLAGVTFLLLGDGPLKEKLLEEMNRAGVRERFVFGGMVDDVASVLGGCDLMVHPSIEEPYGIALVEGMRAGLPIVASKIGGIPEVVDKNCAELVPAHDAKELAQAIVGMVASPDDRRRAYGDSGRRRFEQYLTADKMIGRLESYFQNMRKAERGHGHAKTA